MPYAQIDDGFHDHPKVQGLPLYAIGLWTLCLCWCRRHLTDGRVPMHTVSRLCADRVRARAVQELLSCGLWEQDGDTYVIHDYLDWNDSREDILEARRQDRERKRVSRAAKSAALSDWTPAGRSQESNRRPLASPAQPSPAQDPHTERGSPGWVKSELAKREPLRSLATDQYAGHLLGVAMQAGKVDLLSRALDEAAAKLGAKDAASCPPPLDQRASFVTGCIRAVRATKPATHSYAGAAQREQSDPAHLGDIAAERTAYFERQEREERAQLEQRRQQQRAAAEALAADETTGD